MKHNDMREGVGEGVEGDNMQNICGGDNMKSIIC
jgi:hypothetical protein